MPRTRLDLQNKLESLLGSRNVYFQPPASMIMRYPAIRYKVDTISDDHANNETYRRNIAYQVTVIDKDPESEIAEKVSRLPLCRLVQSPYCVDNLNHFVFRLYF